MSSISWQLDSVPRSDWDVHVQDIELPLQVESHPVERTNRALGLLVLFAIVAILWVAETLFVPMVMAGFLSMCLSPVVAQMARATPRVLATILVMGTLVLGLGILISSLVEPAQEWMSQAPASLKTIALKLKHLSAPLIAANRATESLTVIAGTSTATSSPFPSINLWDAFSAAPRLVVGFFTVLLLAFFFLVFGDNLLRKLVVLTPTLTHKKRAVAIVRAIQHDTSRYLLLTCMINAGLGLATALALWLLHVPDPLLWGALAALCNFVPYVGAITMTVILALVGLLNFPNAGQALLPALCFACIALVEGHFLTPTLIGRQLRLSPVAILIWLMFWGWLWGLVGVALGVPMLMCLKIICERVEGYKWVAQAIEA
jgi:predicted PurR-regulated permease PerM